MNHIKVFWIDDMEDWARTAQANLEIIAGKYDVQLHVISAINGEEVIQQCMMYNFDVILMDYDMSPNNGDKYIRDIRAEEHLELIPIIFYSQHTVTNLESLVEGMKNVETVYRPNLEHRIIERFILPNALREA